MVRTRFASDTARANWSSLIGAAIGVGSALVLVSVRGGSADVETVPFLIDVYLVMWPSFTAVYLVWTHVAHARSSPRILRARALNESTSRARWWSKLLGFGGASSWTLTAALVAVFVTIVIAQEASYRANPLYVILGLLCVASSWALMVYAFALQYLRLVAGDDGRGHIELSVPGTPRFSDYLTLAILLSTMAAAVSATIRSRQAWLIVRTNVLFAFTFNSVIVAMVVALLIGGLLG